MRADDRLSAVQSLFDKTEEDYWKKVGPLAGQHSSDLKDFYHDLLTATGHAVCEVVRLWLGQKPELNVYFWPGYEAADKLGERLAARPSDADEYRILADLGIDAPLVGVGKLWLTSAGPTSMTYHLDQNAYWFNVILRPFRSSHGVGVIYPGSTHAWLLGDPDVVPEVFTVEVGNVRKVRMGETEFLGRLLPRLLGSWAETLQGLIEKATIIKRGEKRSLAKWPSPGTLDGDNDLEILRQLRLRQYEIWLAACFSKRLLTHRSLWNNVAAVLDHDSWPSDVFDARAREEYRDRIRQALGHAPKLPYSRVGRHAGRPPTFTAWYAFSIAKPPRLLALTRERGSPWLGTAMILCSERIPAQCLKEIRQFVRGMYEIARHAEREWKEAFDREDVRPFHERVRPEWAAQFFEVGNVVPHDWETAVNGGSVERQRYEESIRKYLCGLLKCHDGQLPAEWIGTKGLHEAIKSLVGVSSASHGSNGSRNLTLAAVALLLVAARGIREPWVTSLRWDLPDGAKPISVVGLQTRQQAIRLIDALAGDKTGFFRDLGQIARVDLSEHVLRITLALPMTKDLETLLKGEKTELADPERGPGMFWQSILGVAASLAETQKGRQQQCVFNVYQPTSGGMLVEFRPWAVKS